MVDADRDHEGKDHSPRMPSLFATGSREFVKGRQSKRGSTTIASKESRTHRAHLRADFSSLLKCSLPSSGNARK